MALLARSVHGDQLLLATYWPSSAIPRAGDVLSFVEPVGVYGPRWTVEDIAWHVPVERRDAQPPRLVACGEPQVTVRLHQPGVVPPQEEPPCPGASPPAAR